MALARKSGMVCREVNKNVDSGIDTVRTLFLNNRLFIHESCKNLIAELESYRYKEGTEDVIKEGDDLCDALRYALFNKNGIILPHTINNSMQRPILNKNL